MYMYRCPACVSIVVDPTVRRCAVCGENFKRHPPAVIGAGLRTTDQLTSWDIKANADASRLYGNEELIRPDIDLVEEHPRDSSGRTAAAEKG
jgi:hypothetical protein